VKIIAIFNESSLCLKGKLAVWKGNKSVECRGRPNIYFDIATICPLCSKQNTSLAPYNAQTKSYLSGCRTTQKYQFPVRVHLNENKPPPPPCGGGEEIKNFCSADSIVLNIYKINLHARFVLCPRRPVAQMESESDYTRRPPLLNSKWKCA
jgi:hypothetical protein